MSVKLTKNMKYLPFYEGRVRNTCAYLSVASTAIPDPPKPHQLPYLLNWKGFFPVWHMINAPKFQIALFSAGQ